MGDFLFPLFKNAPVSVAIALLFWVLLLLDKRLPLEKMRLPDHSLRFWEKWILILFSFSNGDVLQTAKQSLLVLFTGVSCELEIPSYVLLTNFLLSGFVGVTYSWWNMRDDLMRLEPGGGGISIAKWIKNRGAGASVHGVVVLAAVVAGDRDLELVFGCWESLARMVLPLVQMVPLFFSTPFCL